MNRDILPDFHGEDVYILGGGPSLKKFNTHQLEDRNVIGCNDAYIFGNNIVDILAFGDYRWWAGHNNVPAFVAFTNPIVSNNQKMRNKGEGRVIWFPRENAGFHNNGKLGWNQNTGALAINLALILNAGRILLLGFDMAKNDCGETNWHTHQLSCPTESHYKRYRNALTENAPQIKEKWPDVEVINLNPGSQLECFTKADMADFGLQKEKENEE